MVEPKWIFSATTGPSAPPRSGRSGEAGGLNKTLLDTTNSGHGEILVAITAIGFFLFGMFSIASARYRHLDPN